MPLHPEVQPVIDLLGGPAEAARVLGCFKETFYGWRRIPRRWVLPVSRATGKSPQELRPDLYPTSKD